MLVGFVVECHQPVSRMVMGDLFVLLATIVIGELKHQFPVQKASICHMKELTIRQPVFHVHRDIIAMEQA
jgi:hypothetical protein